MRTLRLARVAAEAEGLRLRRKARRIAIQAVLGIVAMIFLLGALTLVHVAGWLLLTPVLGPVNAAWALAAVDLVIAIILILFASRNPRDPIAEEAYRVREQAREQLRLAFTMAAWLGPLARLVPILVARRLRR